MHQQSLDPGTEVKRLQRCMNDLVSVLALPAVWSGSEPSRILNTFLDALLVMLDLDFLFARVRLDSHAAPIHALRTAQLHVTDHDREEIRQTLNQWLGEVPQRWHEKTFRRLGGREHSVFAITMGIEGELGIIVAGSQRPDFPEQPESLVLNVAANQAAIGLQQAQRLNEQMRVANELDRRVEERTQELARANEELQLQVGLLQHLPVSAWTLKPDGTPDFVNQVWLEFSGQTLDFVRSHQEAWMTAVHPEDREAAARVFWEGVRAGKSFAVETRSLRARDGIYRWHLQQAVVLRDGDGKVLKFVGTTTDIDDQKRAEEALRASESKLVRVIDTIPTLTWSMFPDGPNEFLNKRWQEYTGLSVEESVGWGWQVAFHRDDLPALMKKWMDMLAAGESGEEEARLRRYDGVYRWFLIRAAPFRDETGTIIRWYGTSTDIEDRKQAEEAVLASERSLNLIINTMPVFAWSALPDGGVDFINQRWLNYTGLSTEQALGWGWGQAFHPEDRDRLTDYWRTIMNTGESGEIEGRLRRFDGSYRWFLFRADPLRDQSGTIVKWYGTTTDIHDRKLAERALLANERNLSLIINTMPVLAWSALPDGNVDFFNQRWLDYTGLTQSEAQNWGWASAFHPDDLDRVHDYWRLHILSGEPGEIEARIQKADGSYRWFLIRANPLRDETGEIIKWYGTNTDIDDRKRAEEELRLRELTLRQITETIPQMLWSAGPDGMVDYCNERLLNYAGLSSEAVKGNGWTKFLHPDDVESSFQSWISCVETGHPFRNEARTFHAADQTYRWCVTSALPLYDEDGNIVKWHGTVVDMHDWKQAQEELRNTQAELARMMRAVTVGQLTASIAHEVNQPLSGIIMNASTCLRMLKSDPPNIDGARETVQRTIRDGNRASEVITRLRTLLSKNQIDAEPLDLNEAAREVIALLSSELQRNNVILKHEFNDHLPAVNGDRVQLQQVILNLIHNGSDAMVAVTDRARQLLIRTEMDGNQVTLSVQDSGIGFSPEVSERIFEPFFTTKQEGMGIGLSVSRSIVQAHHGRLWAVRNDGPGATFAFSIPQDAGNLPDQVE
jgi:PAS domain S-box-containing protein